MTSGLKILNVVGARPARILPRLSLPRVDVLAGKGKTGRVPPLWDGQSAKRIVEVLLRLAPRKKHPN